MPECSMSFPRLMMRERLEISRNHRTPLVEAIKTGRAAPKIKLPGHTMPIIEANIHASRAKLIWRIKLAVGDLRLLLFTSFSRLSPVFAGFDR